MEEKTKPIEQDLLIERLIRLNNNEDFILWRDKVAKPLLEQWEQQLTKSDDMNEVVLRANLKVRNTLKALFYDWFENIQVK
jgi:hypothetical protein